MSMQTQSAARRPSPSTPISSNRPRLASATIQAVDHLGDVTVREIEKTADEMMREATEIATKLRALATAIRHRTEVANEDVAGFCRCTSSVLESVVELQERLSVNRHAPTREGAHVSGRRIWR